MLSKVLSLDQLSSPQIWNIEKEKDREKEKVGDRPAKLNAKKSGRELERAIRSHLLEEQHENFAAAVKKREIPAVIKVKMSGSDKKSEQEQVRHFLHKTCN